MYDDREHRWRISGSIFLFVTAILFCNHYNWCFVNIFMDISKFIEGLGFGDKVTPAIILAVVGLVSAIISGYVAGYLCLVFAEFLFEDEFRFYANKDWIALGNEFGRQINENDLNQTIKDEILGKYHYYVKSFRPEALQMFESGRNTAAFLAYSTIFGIFINSLIFALYKAHEDSLAGDHWLFIIAFALFVFFLIEKLLMIKHLIPRRCMIAANENRKNRFLNFYMHPVSHSILRRPIFLLFDILLISCLGYLYGRWAVPIVLIVIVLILLYRSYRAHIEYWQANITFCRDYEKDFERISKPLNNNDNNLNLENQQAVTVDKDG